MQIAKNTVVTLEYTMTNAEGRLLASSEKQGPMLYLHGSNGIIPGLAVELEGRSAGDSFLVTLPAEKAFGARDPEKVVTVDRKHFSGVEQIQPGMKFHAETEEGVRVVTVVSADEKEVVLDANHPWSGLAVTCNIIIREVREAKQEELDHGHACYGDHSCHSRHCEMK
jgi:FKBP-type peptidyl-prolyl cis-trans isomerase SlyD